MSRAKKHKSPNPVAQDATATEAAEASLEEEVIAVPGPASVLVVRSLNVPFGMERLDEFVQKLLAIKTVPPAP